MFTDPTKVNKFLRYLHNYGAWKRFNPGPDTEALAMLQQIRQDSWEKIEQFYRKQ